MLCGSTIYGSPCENEAEESHLCPYDLEINDTDPSDESAYCNCCGDCEQQCAWEI